MLTRKFSTLQDERAGRVPNRTAISRELFIYELETGTRRRLTFTDYPEVIPRWHPNGVDIMDYRFAPEGMYVVSTQAGTSPRALGTGIMPAVTPDGSTLVYAIQHPGEWNFDILARPVDGDSTDARDLIKSPSVDWYPSFFHDYG